MDLRMPLDESTRRLAFVLQTDLRRLIDRERARAEREEHIRYDSVSRMATWETRRGDVVGRWYGEVIARYLVIDRILRWAWAGRASIVSTFGSVASSSHSEIISREGQSRGVPQLAMSVVAELDEEEAFTLARLGVLVARGEGLVVRRKGPEIVFVGLFDSPRPKDEAGDPSRYSVPPPMASPRGSSPPAGVRETGSAPPPSGPKRESSPPAAAQRGSAPPAKQRSSAPPGASFRSFPPITEVYEPRNTPRTPSQPPPAEALELPIREPARAIFVPVATTVLSCLLKVVPGFSQALFVISRHDAPSAEVKRLVVTLAAVDGAGVLRSIDPPDALVEAAALMVDADRRNGNGPWRKLSARILPKPDGGATLKVDVT